MLQVAIITIPKSGKLTTDPANIHHVSLLNVYVKIFKKALVRRLLKYLPALVAPDQVGLLVGGASSGWDKKDIPSPSSYGVSDDTFSVVISWRREGV